MNMTDTAYFNRYENLAFSRDNDGALCIEKPRRALVPTGFRDVGTLPNEGVPWLVGWLVGGMLMKLVHLHLRRFRGIVSTDRIRVTPHGEASRCNNACRYSVSVVQSH